MSGEKDSSDHVFGARQTTTLSLTDRVEPIPESYVNARDYTIIGIVGVTNPDDFITYSTENAESIADMLIGVQSVMDHYRHLKERDLKMSEPLQRKFNRVIACYVVFMQQTKHAPLIKALKEFNEILQDELKTI